MEKVRIIIENEEEELKETFEGQAKEQNEVLYLFYAKENEKNRMEISKNKVRITKTMGKTQEMVIEVGEKHPFLVQTEAGNLLLDTYGEEVIEKSIPSGRCFYFSYGLFQEKNLLTNHRVSVKILYF